MGVREDRELEGNEADGALFEVPIGGRMFTVTTQQQGTVAILHCVGNIDASSVEDLKTALHDVTRGGVVRVVLDVAALTFIDSIGLGALIAASRRLREQDGDITIAAPSRDVQSIFEVTRLHRHFVLLPDVAAACAHFVAAAPKVASKRRAG